MASEKETLEEREEKDAAEVEEKGGVKEDGGEVQVDKVGEEEENHEMEEEKGIENEKEEGNEEKKEQEEGNAGEEEDREEDGGKSKEEDEEENSVKKSVKKRSRKKKGGSELSSPRTPGSDRPTRERKVVERFVVNATSRGSASKPLAIEKGRGTQLKDIPNVAFKLSKRKADENLQLLHSILFGKKSKVHTLKKNIGLFSGFVWFEKEEKQRAKLKEKIDKCVKEKLLDFCDVLNIPVNRAGVKKEEVSTKLLEFLESPHATTDTLLADKEKGKKRKNKDSASKTTSSSNMDAGKSTKKHKLDLQPEKKRKHSTKEEDNDKSDSSQNEDEGNDKTVASSESDQEEGNSEEAHEDQDEPKKQSVIGKGSSKKSARKDTVSRTSEKFKSVGKGIPAEGLKTPGKSTKKSSSSASWKSAAEAESKIKIKAPLAKKQKVDEESAKDTSAPAKNKASSKKQSNKSSIKILEKDQGKGKSSKMAKKEPSKEEMHAVVVDILKEVDFNATTLSDILRQLGNHFEIDLMHRKTEVKAIITEAINNMSDDEVEEAESGDDSGKDEKDDEA